MRALLNILLVAAVAAARGGKNEKRPETLTTVHLAAVSRP